MISINLKLLKSLRETKCLSISDISDYLGYKTPTSWWLCETGQRNISVAVLYKLAKLYEISMEDLIIERGEKYVKD